jgi:hypothetical protein
VQPDQELAYVVILQHISVVLAMLEDIKVRISGKVKLSLCLTNQALHHEAVAYLGYGREGTCHGRHWQGAHTRANAKPS